MLLVPITRLDFVPSLRQHLTASKLYLFLGYYLKNNEHHGQNETKYTLKERPEDFMYIWFFKYHSGAFAMVPKDEELLPSLNEEIYYFKFPYHYQTNFPAFFKPNSKTAGSLSWHPDKGTCASQVLLKDFTLATLQFPPHNCQLVINL